MAEVIALVTVVWVLSLACSLFFITLLKLLNKPWAEEPLIISLILFFGIPISLIIAFIFGLTDIFTNFLKGLVSPNFYLPLI